MANTTVKEVKETNDVMEFYKKYLELATGGTFVFQLDSSSKAEKDGNAYSYLYKLGGNDAETRFQTWITARGKKGVVQVDLYVGNAYIDTETVSLDIKGVINGNTVTLKDFYKNNDKGKGNAFKNVPLWLVEKFYKENALCVTPSTSKNSTVKKSESVTA